MARASHPIVQARLGARGAGARGSRCGPSASGSLVLRCVLLVSLSALLLVLDAPFAAAQGNPDWTLEQLAARDAGTLGGRWTALASDGASVALAHDGDLAGGTNPTGRPQAFLWREGATWRQVSDTGAAPAGATELDHTSMDAAGNAVAFRARADLVGANPDRSAEAFLWRAGGGLSQVAGGAAGAGAEAPSLGRDGKHVAFWHSGDLVGANPMGMPQLFLSDGQGMVSQLTTLSTRGHREGPVLATGGVALTVAFISDSDLVGANGDGSWELYLWTGPPSTPGDPARFRQLTSWAPPMNGREIYHPTISDDGKRVAFAAKGHVDVSQPAGHVPAEIYLWRDGEGLTRITVATAARAGSVLPSLSDDGRHIAFLSQSDLAPGAPGSTDQSAELFLWSEGAGFSQLTSSPARPRLISLLGALRPAIDGQGNTAAFLAEQADTPAPLALASRRGIPFRVRRKSSEPTPAPPTATPSAPTQATPNPHGTATPVGRVCPQAAERIPAAKQAAALAAPEQIEGWLSPRNPSLPPGPFNPRRTWLSLRDLGKPYGPYNSALWKVGCP